MNSLLLPAQHYQTLESDKNQRLDQLLARIYPDHSRSKINQWIEQGRVEIDGQKILKSSHRIKSFGQNIAFIAEAEKERMNWGPQCGNLSIVFEDDSILVINKPAGMVVHPSEGTPDGSLVNFLHYHYPELSVLERCGLIHRLDKGTSGLLLVAKTEQAFLVLRQALQNREIKREYFALVWGEPNAFGTINKPIGRHPIFRKKMAVLSVTGKEAQTNFYRLQQLDRLAVLKIILITGRTHQIRVHFSQLGYPLLGDALYGGRKMCTNEKNVSVQWDRPALHAKRLAFVHPLSGELKEFTVEPPQEFLDTIRLFQKTD